MKRDQDDGYELQFLPKKIWKYTYHIVKLL